MRDLLVSQRTASLATLDEGSPMATLVLYATAADFTAFYLHLSGLALHARNLMQDGRASLLIVDPTGQDDPQLWPRVSIVGSAAPLVPGSALFQEARRNYLGKHPQAAGNFQLGDFRLWRLEPQRSRFVAGFGRIFDLRPEDLARVASQQ